MAEIIFLSNGHIQVGYNTKDLFQDLIYKSVKNTMGINKDLKSTIQNLIRLNLEDCYEGFKAGAYKNIFPATAAPGTIILIYEMIFDKKSKFQYRVPKFDMDQYNSLKGGHTIDYFFIRKRRWKNLISEMEHVKDWSRTYKYFKGLILKRYLEYLYKPIVMQQEK